MSVADYDAVFVVGEQGPMYTFFKDKRVHGLAAGFCEAEKITAVGSQGVIPALAFTPGRQGHLAAGGQGGELAGGCLG